jgi:HSP20 family protein
MSPVIRISNRLATPGVNRRMVVVQGVHQHPGAYAWTPPTDFCETSDAYMVRVEIAGMRLDDFKISLEDRYLIISGRRADPFSERRAFHQMEIRFGEFRTVVILPGPVDAAHAEAVYQDGFLTITLPKAKPNTVEVQIKE